MDRDTGRKPLLEVHRLAVPGWAALGEEIATTSFRRSAGAVPGVVALVVRLAWRASRRLTVRAAVVQVAAGCVAAFGLLTTAEVFTALLREGPAAQRLAASLPAVLLVVASLAGKALLDTAVAAVEGSLRPLVTRAAESEVATSAAGVSLISFEDADFQELARRAAGDGVESVGDGVRQVAGLTAALVSMAAALTTAVVLNPWLAVVPAAAASADGWAAHRISRLNRRHFLDTVTRQMVKGVVAETATSRTFALERHAFVLRDRLLDEHARVTGELAGAEVRLARRSALVRLLGRSIAGVGTAAAYGLLALLLWTGQMPLALAGTAVLTMRVASSALTECLRTVNVLHEGSHHLELYRRFVAEAALRRERAGTVTAPADPETIRLSGVSFTYPGQEHPAVKDVDLTLRRGEVVALVGENGSGKTTLGKLVTGLYPPSAGTVSWEGVDLSTADPRSVHDRIAVIAQTPVEWPVTADLAVRLGRVEHDDRDGARWRRAVELSGADDVLRALPDGPDTLLSRRFENGRDLSGGQWQRLGIARGIYRDAPILVADEPTAALDAKAEARVFAALRDASTGPSGTTRTTILVTHRLANVRHADRIVVLAGGRIAEQGTHDELMDRAGLYHDMYETQAAAYRSGPRTTRSPCGH
ncbi:MAG: ABC transporter ATP-binding protein [Saccharothrix sp.]|nr:ABC transporter ATP-binding protein [Saccharothrix sp.]